MSFIQYLESISGISIFPMVSLFVFLLFFVILFYMVVKMDKQGIDFLKNIPLDDKEQEAHILTTKK